MEYRKHTVESLRAIASKFSRRTELAKADFSAYNLCRYYGLLDEFFPDSSGRGKDNDAVYLLRVIGMPRIYKFGSTSARLHADSRRRQQNICSPFNHEYVIEPTRVVGRATHLEGFVCSVGEPAFEAGSPKFPGHTEYRALSDSDVQQIIDMVELCRK